MSNTVHRKRNVRIKAEDYYGGARFLKASPDLKTRGVKSLNLQITFEEGLKLQLALQSCLQNLNRYNRITREGKSMGIELSIKMDNSSITVIERAVKPN